MNSLERSSSMGTDQSAPTLSPSAALFPELTMPIISAVTTSPGPAEVSQVSVAPNEQSTTSVNTAIPTLREAGPGMTSSSSDGQSAMPAVSTVLRPAELSPVPSMASNEQPMSPAFASNSNLVEPDSPKPATTSDQQPGTPASIADNESNLLSPTVSTTCHEQPTTSFSAPDPSLDETGFPKLVTTEDEQAPASAYTDRQLDVPGPAIPAAASNEHGAAFANIETTSQNEHMPSPSNPNLDQQQAIPVAAETCIVDDIGSPKTTTAHDEQSSTSAAATKPVQDEPDATIATATSAEQYDSEADQYPAFCGQQTDSDSGPHHDDHHNYVLRPHVRDSNTDWQVVVYDQDNTGNYDPEEEQRQLRAANHKRKRQDSPQGLDNGADNPPAAKVQRAEEDQPKLLCILNFTEAVKHRFEAQIKAIEAAEYAAAAKRKDDGHNLRKRRQPEKPQPEADRKSLFSHPVARGCWHCYHNSEDCSVLDDEYDWPCHRCQEEKVECVPIAALKKTACTCCKAASKEFPGLICSYLYENRPDEPCRYCVKQGKADACFAHPDLSTITPRIRPGPDGTNACKEPVTSQQNIRIRRSCLECQEELYLCDLDKKELDGRSQCQGCQIDDKVCHPVSTLRTEQAMLPAIPSAPGSSTKAIPAQRKTYFPFDGDTSDEELASTNEDHSRLPGLSDKTKEDATLVTMKVEASQRGRFTAPAALPGLPKLTPPYAIVRFSTKLRHPVRFNYAGEVLDRSCNFCSNLSYQIRGEKPTMVLGAELPEGNGYQELRAIPQRKGEPCTMVCETCTASRFSIMLCQAHELAPLQQESAQTVDVQDAEWSLNMNMGEENWCSVCYNIATFACVAQKPIAGVVAAVNHGDGCGLKLCEPCARQLQACRGRLSKMLSHMKDRVTSKRPRGLRADWELLKQPGVLEKYVQAAARAQAA